MYVSPGVVVGFHGRDQSTADEVIKNGGTLADSTNDYDWLGQGIYFWEGSHERAIAWAKSKAQSKHIRKPAVVGAFLKLGKCLDLLDSEHLETVKVAHQILEEEFQKLGMPLPENKVVVGDVSFMRELDCKVMLRLQQLNNENIALELGLSSVDGQNKRKIQNHPDFIDSVRGMFPEGKELYRGAGFRDKNHIQLCIVNPNCIAGYFEPRQANSWYKKL